MLLVKRWLEKYLQLFLISVERYSYTSASVNAEYRRNGSSVIHDRLNDSGIIVIMKWVVSLDDFQWRSLQGDEDCRERKGLNLEFIGRRLVILAG